MKRLAATIVALAALALPAGAGAQTLNGVDCTPQGCTGESAAIDCWIPQRVGWQPIADEKYADWRATKVRQRADGRYEVLVPVEPFRCPEVIPGLRVAVEDVPAVKAYLAEKAGLVDFGGELVPGALDLYDWGRLAACESTGRWHLRDGGVQIVPSTWRAFGGLGFAPLAGQASVADQLTVARRVLDAGGEAQWTCKGW